MFKALCIKVSLFDKCLITALKLTVDNRAVIKLPNRTNKVRFVRIVNKCLRDALDMQDRHAIIEGNQIKLNPIWIDYKGIQHSW